MADGDPSDEAVALHERGRTLCAQGDLPGGLELLFAAYQRAPRWPYPPYDMAFTYLLADQLEEAERWYGVVDKLAPRGFFTAKTSLATVRRERHGDLPGGFSKAYAMLEWLPPRERRTALEDLVAELPDFAPAWKDLAALLEDDDARLAAIVRGLAATPDPETAGVLQVNRALILDRRGERAEAIAIVRAIVDDPAATLASAQFAEVVLTQLTAAPTTS